MLRLKSLKPNDIIFVTSTTFTRTHNVFKKITKVDKFLVMKCLEKDITLILHGNIKCCFY